MLINIEKSALKKVITLIIGMLACGLILTACGGGGDADSNLEGDAVFEAAGAKQTLHIVSGSENKELERLIEKFVDEKKINVIMDYQGSLDIMRLLDQDVINYDAVWPASSLWISVGDTRHRVKNLESTSTTPVVFGIKKSLAESLGFIGKDVAVNDILAAIKTGKLKFTMTSATQSNSGASAYIGFIYALLNNPQTLTLEALDDLTLQQNLRDLLSGVERSSGSSDWLKDLYLAGDYDSMVNYEALIISANQTLEAQGKEPLYVIYPRDGLTIADSPLGFISDNGQTDRNESEQETAFLAFQEYIMSESVQNDIQRTGRRTGYSGVSKANSDIFRSDWGIDTDRVITAMNMPKAEVLFKALNLYQTNLKKPSATIYCLDFSGSMSGAGRDQLVQALSQVMLDENAQINFLQASTQEFNEYLLFDSKIIKQITVNGGGESLAQAYDQIASTATGDSTDLYGTAIQAVKDIQTVERDVYSPAIVLMTDGLNNGNYNFEDFKAFYESQNIDVPVFTILFGSADEKELQEIAELTNGRVFDGREDLIKAFQTVRGYN